MPRRRPSIAFVLLAGLVVAGVACTNEADDPASPPPSDAESASTPGDDRDSRLADVMPPSRLRFADPVELPGARAPMAFVDVRTRGDLELWTPGGTWVARPKLERRDPVREIIMARGFTVADFSGDGVVDLAVGYEEGGDLLQGKWVGETLTFVPWQIVPIGFDVVPAAGDIDEDRDLDLLLTDDIDAPRWRLNPGEVADRATPPDPTPWPTSDEPFPALERSRFFLARDFDEDGHLDGCFSNEAVPQILARTELGVFERRDAQTGLPWTSRWRSLAAADFDGDGHEDLAVVVSHGRGIWYGDGSGEFAQPASYEAYFIAAFAVATTDLDLDGRPDVVVVGDRQTIVLLNRGARRFEDARVVLPGGRGLAVGDLDGDLDPDLVIEREDGALVYVANETPRPEGRHVVRIYPLRSPIDPKTGATDSLDWGARLTVTVGREAWSATYDGGFSQHALGHVGRGRQPVVFSLPESDAPISLVVDGPGGRLRSDTVPNDVNFWRSASTP